MSRRPLIGTTGRPRMPRPVGGRSVHSIKTDDRQVEQRLNADYRKAIAKR
ncbi:hypothetical protein [Micromonospora sp. NPDC005299]